MLGNHPSYSNSAERLAHPYQSRTHLFLSPDHFFDPLTQKDEPDQLETFLYTFDDEGIVANSPSDPNDKIEETDDIFFYSADEAESDFDVDDSIALYLKEISRIPLLNAEEEVEIAKAIERGRKAGIRLAQAQTQANSYPRERLRSEVRRGKEARRKLIEANFRLVVSIAKKYGSSVISVKHTPCSSVNYSSE